MRSRGRRECRLTCARSVSQATVVFSSELQRRYGDQGIISVSLHPGNLKTDVQRHVSPLEKVLSVRLRSRVRALGRDPLTGLRLCLPRPRPQAPLLHPASMGALTQLWAGTTPDGLALGGEVRDTVSVSGGRGVGVDVRG